MRRAALALPLVLLLAASSCGGGDPGTDPDRLAGITWVLDAASTGSLLDEPPAGARVDIRFDDGELRGTSGCNQYGGSYEAGGDGTISFGAMMMTEMACDEPRMALESAYIEALGAVTGFQVTDNGLLLTGGTVALTYTEEVPMDALPLEGTAWTLDTIASGTDAVSSVLNGTTSTLSLADGQAGGSAGCNTFSGAYELDGTSLTFGPLASTLMACAEEVMAQEATIFEALGSVASWSVEENRLSLLDADAHLLLGYTGAAA